MRILMVLEREFPPDDRVEKEAVSLMEAGHEVHIACYTRHHQPEYEIYDGYTIFRKPISKFIYKSSAAVLILPFYFCFWKRFINKLFNQNAYDAIHIHDLPLVKLGYEIKTTHNIKLVCDQHEYYSDWITQTAHYNTIPGKILKTFSSWKAYERHYLSTADAVITVELPLKEIYTKKLGLPENRVIIIPNTPRKSVFNNRNIRSEIIEKYKDRFVLLYIGGLDRLRGLNLALRAVEVLKDHIPGLLLLFVGPKSKYYDIASQIAQFSIDDYFEWVPFQPIELLPSYILASDICFFTPELNREEIHRTIATKIYQYLALGKPIIVTRAKLMQRFVESNKIGFAVDDVDPNDFFQKVLMIAKDGQLQNELKKNAQIISKQFFWEVTVHPLIELYESW